MENPPKKGRLTLYEDLLSAETLAEMKAKDAAAQDEAKKKKDAPALMFKPTNLGKKTTTKPAKAKPTFASMHKLSSSTSTSTVISAPPTTNITESSPVPQPQQLSSTPQQQSRPGQKRGFEDWLADEDQEWQYYERPKGDRGGRKKKKKKNKQFQEESWSWDDIYDPTIPVDFQQYPKSDAYYDINEAWKRRLYDARKREQQRQGKSGPRAASSEDDGYAKNRLPPGMNFAPPGNLNFAPPTDYSSDPYSQPQSTGPSSPQRDTESSRPSFKPVDISNAASGDDAYAQRLAMSGMAPDQPSLPSFQPPAVSASPTPPAAPSNSGSGDAAEKAARAAAQIAAFKAKVAAMKPAASASPPVAQHPSQPPAPSIPVVTPEVPAPSPPAPPPAEEPSQSAQAGTISAAPTYNLEYYVQKANEGAYGPPATKPEAADTAEPSEDPEAPRSNRPGQAGFAERMLKKMGWEKGQGLGASGDGITTAISVKAEKRKKRSDAVGGGFETPANMGKIVGGKKKASAKTEDASAEGDGVFGNMSEVVKFEDMLKGLDVDHEIQENNLLQEIGDEVAEFGTVERLFIWREHMGGSNDVFIKFTSQLSALRAVRAMDGVDFAGNIIKAKFWDAEKFEKEEYA